MDSQHSLASKKILGSKYLLAIFVVIFTWNTKRMISIPDLMAPTSKFSDLRVKPGHLRLTKINLSAIPGYFFRTPEEVYQSKSNPENHCYCSPNLPEGWCTERDGIRMFDQCQFGAPGKTRPSNDLEVDL